MMRRGVLLALAIVCLTTQPLLVNTQQDDDSGENVSFFCGQPPRVEHGSQQVYNSGNLVVYRCTGQHILYGDSTLKCQANGKWDGTAPVCSASGCSNAAAPKVQNARINQYNGGSVRVYQCHAGYRLQGEGSQMIYCDGTNWRNQPPRCVRIIEAVDPESCGSPPRIANAMTTRTPDSLLKYTCPPGFQSRLGVRTIRCGRDGQWSGTPAVCAKRGCNVPDLYKVANGFITKKNWGSILKVQCLQGYELQGSGVLYCNGQDWNGTLPTCSPPAVRQAEGYPASIRDGTHCPSHIPRVLNSGTSYSTKYDANGNPFYAVIYTCNSGYTLSPHNYFVYCSARNIIGTPPNCISTCSSYNNGGCRQICKNSPGGAVCSCRDGYRLASDGKNCNDNNECSANSGRGPCQHTCRNFDGGFNCLCDSGYSLALDKTSCSIIQGRCNCGRHGRCVSVFGTDHRCQCYEGYKTSSDGLRCVEDRCSCGVGTWTCTMDQGEKTCICKSGYRLNGTQCIDIDECAESQDGRAGCEASCHNTPGSYQCYCPGTWRSLAYDQRSCRENPCSCGRGSTSCSQPNGQKTCTCDNGYKLAYNGISCTDRNECDEESSLCHDECINTQGSYRCRCTEPGYQLATDRHSCEDIDECSDPESHRCMHLCINTPGSYRCECPSGHFLMPDGISCKGCRANSYRSSTSNACVECPANSKTFGRGKASVDECYCLQGFTRDTTTQEVLCKDNNECAQDNGGCRDRCINTPGSFYCTCRDGYKLTDDGMSCIDNDECSLSNGGCHHDCSNTDGSFICSCREGYDVDPSDSYRCVDVDECSTGANDCQQICVNFPGSFHCQCDDKSIPARDGKTCIAVTCSPLIAQEWMTVSPSGKCLGTAPGSQINVETTCTLGCQPGYELRGNGNRTCMNTGQWSGQPATCEPIRCPALSHPANGRVEPESCLVDEETQFRTSCVYTCREGYTMVGDAFTECLFNGEWSIGMPLCKEVSEITCPRDVWTELALGYSDVVVELPKPVHTLDRLDVTGVPAGRAFPAGRTTVTYTARSNSSKSTASCSFDVLVNDEESPVFEFCPESFTLKTAEKYPAIEWAEPVATDNVAVVSNNTWISPDGRFTWGMYTVVIEVSDAAGNSATCKFSISIQSIECVTPDGPMNGDSSCSDWVFGKICSPQCNQSHYFFHGPLNNMYICGFNGIWNPSPDIPDCSPYYFLGNQSTCSPGNELKTFAALGAPVCIACPRGMYSVIQADSNSTCLPCAVGTYQDGFGQEECKSCPVGQTTATEGTKTVDECVDEEVPTTFPMTDAATVGVDRVLQDDPNRLTGEDTN